MLTDHIAAFVVSCRASGLSVRTIDWYADNLFAFAKWLHVRDFRDPALMREFVAHLQARGLAVATVRGYIRTLKRFSRWLIDEERIVTDPSARIALPKLPRRVPRGIAMVDFKRLLDAARSPRDRAVLLVLADTGCRASELCAMRLCDLKLSECIVLVKGKGNQERFAFLSPLTCDALRVWLDSEIKKRDVKKDFLFTSRSGAKLNYAGLREIVLRLKRKAGVTARCNLHSFRHGFAREYLMRGGDLATLSDILGHRDIATTKIYSTFALDDLRRKHRQHSPIAALEKA